MHQHAHFIPNSTICMFNIFIGALLLATMFAPYWTEFHLEVMTPTTAMDIS